MLARISALIGPRHDVPASHNSQPHRKILQSGLAARTGTIAISERSNFNAVPNAGHAAGSRANHVGSG